jgi:hypothetical protein
LGGTERYPPSFYNRYKNDMKKIIIYILITIILIFLSTVTIRAESVSDSSASLKSGTGKAGYDFRVENLRKFLDTLPLVIMPRIL